MTRATPWADLDGCIAELTKRRDVLTHQIEGLEALRSRVDDRDVQLILRYVVIGSTKGVAIWANEQGWQHEGAIGNQRQYSTKDINTLLTNPPEGVNKELVSLICGIFNANLKQVNRSYG